MAYQLDVQSSLVNVHSRFISRIFQSQDYQSYNDPKIIQNYIQRKKDSGKIDDKIFLQYSNRNSQIQNYHLRLVTFFLKEGINHVALAFIQNDCLIKLIDVKYGFNTNNLDIQIFLLKFIDQYNLWSTFSPQIERLLSQLQPYSLFQLITTYPAINNHGIRFQNPQFATFIINNINSQLRTLQYSQFQSQVNHQLSLLQQQFQKLSDKESLLIQKEQDLQLSRPPLSSYPIRPSFTSASNDNDKEHAEACSNSPKSRNLSQTFLFEPSHETPTNNIPLQTFNDNPFDLSSNQPSPAQSPTAPLPNQTSTAPLSNQPSPPQSSTPPKQTPNKIQPSPPQQTPINAQPSPIPSLFDSPKQPSPHNSQYLLSYLHNQLSSYFDPNSNKTSKTKITKEVKQLLKQKTIQKNSLFQQYIDSYSNNINSEQHKLLQKWFDTKLSS